MTTEYELTREAYEQFLGVDWDALSEPACDLVHQAVALAHYRYTSWPCRFDPMKYDETLDKMCVIADGLTCADYPLIRQHIRAALTKATSLYPIYPEDDKRLGTAVYVRNLYDYYLEIARILDLILEVKLED